MANFEDINWSDSLNLHSMATIESLQEKLAPWEHWISHISVLGDNREAFIFFFPLLTGMSITCGAKLLWAAVFVEWSNLILKWMFSGDRPYWYVMETPYYTNATRPVLRQFPNTCESGPGTPSGHLMMNVAIFYIFIKSICQLFVWDNRLLSTGMQKAIAGFLYTTYVVWIGLVFLSRVYIQAHFIHQCVFGILAGMLVGWLCWKWEDQYTIGMGRSMILASLLFFSAGSVWVLMARAGYDPMWSVDKAQRYCSDPVHVKVDAQPYFIMARFTGAAMGLGLGMSSELGYFASCTQGRLLRAVLSCKAGVFMGRLTNIMLSGLPTHNIAQYLSLSMGVHAALPYTVVTTLPYFLTKVLPHDAMENAKMEQHQPEQKYKKE